MEMKKEYLREIDAFGKITPSFGTKLLKPAPKFGKLTLISNYSRPLQTFFMEKFWSKVMSEMKKEYLE